MIKGIFPPLATPFESGKLDSEALTSNIEKLLDTGLHGVVVLGSNGEAPYLNDAEKRSVIETARSAVPPDRRLIAGTGCESLAATMQLTSQAADLGADFALVLTPSFYRGQMTDNALRDYYVMLADSSSIPIIIYNVPKFTGIDISPTLVGALSRHDNIVAVKSSVENLSGLAEMVHLSQAEFAVLAGTGSVIFPALMSGAAGGIVALANIAPRECLAILDAVRNGDFDLARTIQQRMIDLNRAVTATYGVAGLKYAMDLLGYRGGLPRRPLQPLNESEQKGVAAALKRAGIVT